MKYFKIFPVIILIITAFLFAGCQKKQEKSVLNHEQPISTMVRAIKIDDTDSYLNCFTPSAIKTYKESDEYNSRLTEVLIPQKGENTQTAINSNLISSNELSDKEIKKLQNEYKDKYKYRIDILKAYNVSVEFTTIKNNKNYIDDRNIVVINTDNGWLVYGNIIDSFDFKEEKIKN